MPERRGPRPVVTIPLWIIAVLATLLFLRTAATLLIPIVLAVIISYALEPVVAWLERRGVHRLAATTILLASLLGLLGWGAWSLRDNMAAAAESLPQAAERLRDAFASQTASGPAAHVAEAAETLQGSDDGGATEGGAGGARQHPGALPGAAADGIVQRGVQSAVSLAGHAMVVVFLVFFLLASGQHFRRRLIEIAGAPERRETAARIVDDINLQIQRFLLVRLVTAVVVGVATWGVLAWMGVANAAVWAVLAGAFNSIPYFGPVIVSGGLFIVGLVQDGSLAQALQMSGAALVITSLEGWLLTPPLLGRAERMSALAVFLGLLLWTWVWGAWGTLLAVPMLVIVKSVADHVESLDPVSRLLAR